jgi:hypothetical protein
VVIGVFLVTQVARRAAREAAPFAPGASGCVAAALLNAHWWSPFRSGYGS